MQVKIRFKNGTEIVSDPRAVISPYPLDQIVSQTPVEEKKQTKKKKKKML